MIKLKTFIGFKLSTRLLIYMIILILLSCLTIGESSYYISSKALDEKGKVNLKNGVEMAFLLIDSKNKDVLKGNVSLEEAQEQVKIALLGEKNANGTRNKNSKIDLGKNGYFIIYSKTGLEIMHPTMEGSNVWSQLDKSTKPILLVQDQISKAMNGGGYSTYIWNLPSSNKLGKKISYSKLDPDWEWIVTATEYTMDYNKDAYSIIIVMFITSIILLILVITVSIKFIKEITKPISNVVSNMKLTENGYYSPINERSRADEIGDLVLGFNEMVNSINNAKENLIIRDKEISYLAYYDQLSGLPNRNKLKEHINNRINAGVSQAYFILLDIKDFNIINSTLGNKYGDKIIMAIGNIIKNYQGTKNIISRVSGNEFAAWIEGWNEIEIKPFIKLLKGRLTEDLKEIGFNQKFYFHISYCIYPNDAEDFDFCFKKASIAMKYAKENSPTDIYKFQHYMKESVDFQTNLANSLGKAIAENEFTVFYQNKVNAADKSIIGVEALARWYSKEMGIVSPAVFVPAIDKAILTSKFSKMIISKVLRDYTLLEKKFSSGITVSINISPIFFFQKDFTKTIIEAVTESGVNPKCIILEITEDVFINDFKYIQKIIMELKHFGLKISLDDFGTGYSSLNYIKNIAFDEIKIDKSFIDDLLKDKRILKLLKSIYEIAKTYDCSLVAEGVETEEQLKKLTEIGFNIVQGYIYSKPEPL